MTKLTSKGLIYLFFNNNLGAKFQEFLDSIFLLPEVASHKKMWESSNSSGIRARREVGFVSERFIFLKTKKQFLTLTFAFSNPIIIKMITTVIFDMDGVIVDTEPVHYFAYHQHFKELNIAVSPEMYASFTGNSTRNIYERLKSHFHLKEETADLVNRKRNLFNEAFDLKSDLYLLPGVEKLIQDFHANNVQLVLASSSAHVTIQRIFKRFNLNKYFAHIVSGEEFPKSKPDPAIFNKAVVLSGHPKEQCVVIEDSTNGVKAANAAGIFCIGYNSKNSKMQDLSTADKTINHFDELNVSIIKNLNQNIKKGLL